MPPDPRCLWRKAGFDVIEDVATSLPKFDGIDVVVTGTGFSAREQIMWLRAQAAGLPSLAVVDAWTSLERRFKAKDGHVQPDAVGVLDHELADELNAMAWWCGRTPCDWTTTSPDPNGQACRCADGAEDG